MKIKNGAAMFIGTVVTAATLLATETVCCVPVWLMDPTGPSKCTGLSVTTCERAPTTATTGLKFSGSLRLAKCWIYASNAVVVQRACSLGAPPGSGWIKVPGEVSTGVCCWIQDPAVQSDNQTFQIEPCGTEPCP
jgi:hypothetical protein